MSKSALKHIEHLSVTIGPRGSGTAQEKEGHDYVQRVLDKLGLETRVDPFLARTSPYPPFILGLGLVLLAEGLFYLNAAEGGNPQLGALAALVLSLIALGALICELLSIDNPLRWFVPSAPSQNVIGVQKSRSKNPRRVAVLAHADSHKTPLFFRTPVTFAVYRALTPLGLLSVVALIVIYGWTIAAPSALLRAWSLLPAGPILLVWLMVLQAHFTPYTAGANDNASGAGVMLALAEKLMKKPLKNTEVWWVGTGCEENGAYGSADFVRRYRDQFRDGVVIVVDNVAGRDTGPVYLDSEGIFFPVRYPAEMLRLLKEVSDDNPEWGGRVISQSGAYTDGTAALQAGIKCITFVGYQRDGWIPTWHNPADTFANVDAAAVDNAEKFVMEVLQRLDA